jgi:NAD(P) transhydrogenase subunit beta
MLSNPKTARNGNVVAAIGMALAIAGTIALYTDASGDHLGNHIWIFGGLAIGGVIGTMSAKNVKMTAMPQMVSIFNGMGGACAALISIIEFEHLVHDFQPELYAAVDIPISQRLMVHHFSSSWRD